MEQAEHPLEDRGFTLADFINAWAKRWKLFVLVVFAFLSAGFVYFQMRPLEPFVFRTTMEVGTDATGKLIEPIEVVKGKFRDSFIPEVLAAHAQEHGYEDQRYWVEIVDGVTVDGRRNIEESSGSNGSVSLKSRGSEPTRAALLEIHQRIADRFLRDHENRIIVAKQEIEEQRLHAELELESLTESLTRLPNERKRLDGKLELLRKQIGSTQETIAATEQDRSRAIAAAASRESVDQSLATTFLLVDSSLSQLRTRLQELEERFFVGTAREYVAIDQQEQEIKRKQRVQRVTVKDLEFKIANFYGSRIILAPSQLPRPPQIGVRHQTLAIFGGIGFILGLFLVAFVEFASDVRRQARMR